MKAAIEQALSVLLGLPLWDSGRAAGLQWFHLGDRREVTDARGRARIVGAYALHVQCAWHLAGPAGIVVASDDRYVAARDAPFDRGDEWAWDRPGANRCDERMTAFFAAFAGDNVGGMRLSLSDDLV